MVPSGALKKITAINLVLSDIFCNSGKWVGLTVSLIYKAMDFSGCKYEDNLLTKWNGFGLKRKQSVGDANQPKKSRVHTTESGILT